jgi:hypothetical protein
LGIISVEPVEKGRSHSNSIPLSGKEELFLCSGWLGSVCCAAALALAGVLAVSSLTLAGVLTLTGMLFFGCRGSVSSLTDGCEGRACSGRCGCVEGRSRSDKQPGDSGADHESFHGILHIEILLKDRDCRLFQPVVILERKKRLKLQRAQNILLPVLCYDGKRDSDFFQS